MNMIIITQAHHVYLYQKHYRDICRKGKQPKGDPYNTAWYFKDDLENPFIAAVWGEKGQTYYLGKKYENLLQAD